ncbi:MAG: hypothetical protein RMI56_03345 [Sulfolobales archaeon]|nr:hypothetical protein [Sulfolobales archaeon]MDW8082815.1 hypothetical protein [Sulfolobales archaeon]
MRKPGETVADQQLLPASIIKYSVDSEFGMHGTRHYMPVAYSVAVSCVENSESCHSYGRICRVLLREPVITYRDRECIIAVTKEHDYGEYGSC